MKQPAASRDEYRRKGLAGIPRLLTLEDRSEYSPTYGCMDREFWLCRSTDFPSSIAQFGLHALAIAYSEKMPGNPYAGHPKVRRWVEAGLDFFTKIQHTDGSYDEFYPNERGWAGPTGFLVYAMVDSHRRIGGLAPAADARFRACIRRAAQFLCTRDESGVLANHHAIALAAIAHADGFLGGGFREGFEVRWKDFERHCHPEGWCLEYDGADPGYLSATVSFLAKIDQAMPGDPRVLAVARRAVEYAAHFAYPDGHYAGTIGSRNTLHFYPAGFEHFGDRIPLAHAVADRMLRGLAMGALVPPEIMEDRYFVYRVPEMLLSYLAWRPRRRVPPLPDLRPPFDRYFEGARTWVHKGRTSYTCVHLGKGGVVKAFDVRRGTLVAADAGFVLRLASGVLATNQWLDPSHRVEPVPGGFAVSGRANRIVTKTFTPARFLAFRIFVLALGWHTGLAYRIKGWIRALLMLGARPAPVAFRRTVRFEGDTIEIADEIRLEAGAQAAEGWIGGDFAVRYVPQSRYFQPHELQVDRERVPAEAIAALNRGEPWKRVRRLVIGR